MENVELKKIENNEILFFLGAGASVPAEVPDTTGFIYGNKGFKERIKYEGSEEEQSTLQEILTVLEKKQEEINKKHKEFTKQNKDKEKSEKFEGIKREKEKFEKIDVELVLETLYKLNNKEVGILPDFYDEATFKIKGKEESLKSLEKELRRFIREKTIISEDKIGYLAPLKEFVDEYEMLDIFSVNYDICIEQFCKEYGLRYTDGFELYWHPGSFDKRDYDVKLYKLHGSVMWYLTDRGTYVKIPIAEKRKDEIELITGETAKTLMVYPMGGKWEYAEPLLELIRRLHERLKKAKVCIVIGYSFRDDYIRRIFFEAARKNKDLTMFLISPDAGKIYYDKLEFIDKDKGIPSSLEGRVICWNYPVENILGNYYLYRSLEKLFDIRKGLEEAQKAGREKGRTIGLFQHGMHNVVSKCTEIGHTSLAEKILAEEFGITSNFLMLGVVEYGDLLEKLRIFCGLGLNNLCNRNYDRAMDYFAEIKSVLEDILFRGNKYFEYESQLTDYNTEGNSDKIAETENKIKKIKADKTSSEYLTWFMQSQFDANWVTLLKRSFIEPFKKEIDLRPEGDTISSHLSNIMVKCNQMKYALERPYNESIYITSDVKKIRDVSVEITGKNEAEENLKNIITTFGDLITFCEGKKKETVQ